MIARAPGETTGILRNYDISTRDNSLDVKPRSYNIDRNNLIKINKKNPLHVYLT